MTSLKSHNTVSRQDITLFKGYHPSLLSWRERFMFWLVGNLALRNPKNPVIIDKVDQENVRRTASTSVARQSVLRYEENCKAENQSEGLQASFQKPWISKPSKRCGSINQVPHLTHPCQRYAHFQVEGLTTGRIVNILWSVCRWDEWFVGRPGRADRREQEDIFSGDWEIFEGAVLEGGSFPLGESL